MKKIKLLFVFLTLTSVCSLKSQNWMQKGSDIHNTYANWTGNGYSVATNNDGSRLIVGAPYESSYNAKIYQWNSSTHSWDAEVGYSGYGTASKFGWDVDMSDDGNRAIIVQGYGIGRIYVKTYSSGSWQSSGDIITGCYYSECAISGDGNYIAYNDPDNDLIKVYYYNGSSWVQRGSSISGFTTSNQGIDMDYDGSRFIAGGFSSSGNYVVKMFEWNGSDWAQLGSDLTNSNQNFGKSVSMSDDGNRVIIGNPGGSSSYVHVYEYNGSSWSQIKDWYYGNAYPQTGKGVSISKDGTVVSFVNQGSPGTYSSYLFTYKNTSGTTWQQVGQTISHYPVPSSPADYGYHCVELSGNGEQVVVSDYSYSGWLGFVRSYAPVTTPTTQASNITFSNVQHNQMQLDWTNGDGMSRVVFMKAGNSGSLSVTQNNSYTANASFGSGSNIYYGGSYWYCVYNGTGSSVTVSNLSPNTDYQCQVFEYNGNISNYKLYLNDTETGNPANQTTGTTTPTVSTTAISSITATSASSGGNVSSDGGLTVSARGVVWNTSGTPTVDSYNGKTTDGTGTGSFSSSLTNLSGNTTYYVRAYATNSSGTSYGTERNLTTTDYTEITWDGSESSDWNTGANWSSGSVANSNNNVVIPNVANDPVIGAAQTANCNNLSVGSSGSLIIESGASLITTGSVTNDGTIEIQRTINGSNQWYMISSPMVADISNSGWNPTLSTDDFYAWYEPSPGIWVNYFNGTVSPTFSSVNNSTDNFLAGKGYLVSYLTGGTKSITGSSIALNSGNVDFSIAYSGGKNPDWEYANGWNLLGNPYPSGIDWNLADRSLFADDWAYVYDADYNGGDYREIDGSSADAFIAPNQGFFVIADQTGTFTFTNAMRAHGGTFYKSSRENDEDLVLRLSNENYITETKLRQREASTNERDRMDALKLFSFNPEKPQLFSISKDNVWLAINSMPEFTEMPPIPLGLRIPKDGVYEISISNIPEQLSGVPIYIEDLHSGQWHQVDDISMSFTEYAGDVNDRFVLHLGAVGIDETEYIKKPVQVYSHGKNITIVNNHNLTGDIVVLNILGRQVESFELQSSSNQTYVTNLPYGVYVVYVKTSAGQVYTEKVIVN